MAIEFAGEEKMKKLTAGILIIFVLLGMISCAPKQLSLEQLLEKGYTLLNENKYEAALACFEYAYEMDEYNEEVLKGYAKALYGVGNGKKAAEIFSRIGDFDTAAEIYDEYIWADLPHELSSYFAICDVFLKAFGYSGQAKELAWLAFENFSFDFLLSSNLKELSKYQFSIERNIKILNNLVENKKYEEAIDLCRTFIKQESESSEYIFILAETYVVHEDYSNAMELIQLHSELFSETVRGLKIKTDVYAHKPIEWKEPLLEECVRLFLNKPFGDIYIGDLSGINGVFLAGYDSVYGMSSHNVGELRFNFDYIYKIPRNLSTIEDLSNFHELKYINMILMETTGYEAITELPYLTEFYATGCKINDISFVSGMERLNNLGLDFNNITDISPIKDLKLDTLNIERNPIKDYSVLDGMDIPNLFK